MAMTVMEIGEQVRESNERLTRAIEKLGDRFDRFQDEVTGRLGTIDTKLSAIDTNLRWAKWIGGLLAAAALTAIGFTYDVVRRSTQLEDAVVTLQRETLASKDSRDRNDQFGKAMATLERIEKAIVQNPSASKPKE